MHLLWLTIVVQPWKLKCSQRKKRTAGLFREAQYFLCLLRLMCVSYSGMSFFLRRGTLSVGGCSFVSLSLSDSFSLSGCASLQGWEGKCWPALFLCLLLGHGAPPSPHSYLFLRHLPILCHQGEGNLSPAWYIQFITVPQTRFKIKVWSTKLKQVEIKIGIGQRRREQSKHVVLFHLFWFMLSRRAVEKLKHYLILSVEAYVVVIKAKTVKSSAG